MHLKNLKLLQDPTTRWIKHCQEWLRLKVLPAGYRLQEQLLHGLADSCEQEQTMESRTNHPLQSLLRFAFICLAHLRARWSRAESSARSVCIGCASFLGAVLLTFSLRGLLHNEASLLFLSAVMVSAILGGLRAGLLTTSLIVLPCIYLLHHAAPAAHASVLFRMGLFTLLALITCALSDSLYLARQQAENARRQAQNLARRSQFLAQASALLDSSHDPVTLAMQVTHAIVPAFAEGALVDLLDSQQTLRRAAAMHQSPEKETLLHDLNFRFPLDIHSDNPVANALRTGKAELIEQVDDRLLTRINDDADYLHLARQLGMQSLLVAPLIARGQTFGALTLISTSGERRYTPTDLVVARDLALRMALALDNLRLYREAQEEIIEHTQMAQQIREYSQSLEEQRLQLEEANIRLSLQVNTDGLTGLNNHMAFQETLAREVQRATRYHSPLSALLLDVDKFKQYNDTYGHPAGDKVLKKVAEVLKASARETDFVARYGGEEFAVILPNTSQIQALEVAERLRAAIEAMQGLERIVTASFGAATLNEHTAAAPELVSWTDKALYASKHAGRNRVTHADTLFKVHTDADAVVSAPANPLGHDIQVASDLQRSALNAPITGNEAVVEAVVSIRDTASSDLV